MSSCPDADLDLAGRLADAAGAAIRPFFRKRFAMEAKADRSPVTEADRAAEAAMRAILAAERPEDGVIGEEYGPDRPDAERVWVLDPIDGTRSFVAGRPIFGTLVALVEAKIPVLGIIDQPIARERWIGAAGAATTLNGAPVTTRACAALAEAHLATTGPGYFTPASWAAFERVRVSARDTLWGGDCYNYGLLAAGHLDLVIEDGLKLYDFAALVPIVEGAGGTMRDWQGGVLTMTSDGKVIAAGDPRLIDAAVAALA
ncbi:MAG TPA: histidinol-phosphatase [Sphingomonas sp.]|uniref:histidinol-phosphatase n=1 Tax=Sphingomonas sp. TaxID=28214 RepID=UPI002BE9799D|nr:histidinol-phosphatase [Sphingomonas sp.]HMI18752.1 histidinol-phosphatase [Sphingomonas sp.]